MQEFFYRIKAVRSVKSPPAIAQTGPAVGAVPALTTTF
jgi:hypothetical protein